MALIPKSTPPFNYSNHGVVPFSGVLIANVLQRMLTRDSHQTVDGSGLKKLFLALSFVKLYNNIAHLSEKKEEGGIQKFFEISFHNDSPELDGLVPKYFIDELKKTLRELKAFQSEETVCSDLLAVMESDKFKEDIKPVLGYGDLEQQKTQIKAIMGIFNELGLPPN